MPPSSEEEERTPLLQFLNSPSARSIAAFSPEKKLRLLLHLLRTPLPEREEELSEWMWQRALPLYVILMGPGVLLWAREDSGEGMQQVLRTTGPPPPSENEWPQWISTLQAEAHRFLTGVFSQLTKQQKGAKIPQSTEELYTSLPSVTYTGGRRYSLVRGGKLIHVHDMDDQISPFLLTLGDLLAEVDLSKLSLCPCCLKPFYKVRRQQYCSLACTRKAHPAKGRVQESRKRKARWQQAHERLSLLLDDMDAVAHKRKPQRPRSERAIFEESEQALGRAQAAFEKAFPRKTGQGYEEGEAFLARASGQIKRLRKKVKGY